MALDSVASFLRLKNITNTRKRMPHRLRIGGSSYYLSAMAESWKKLKASMCFSHLLCVRIEIDQLQCVNC